MNGHPTTGEWFNLVIPQMEDGPDVWAATVPAASSFTVQCVLRESNGGFFEDDATKATVNVTAQRVGSLNP